MPNIIFIIINNVDERNPQKGVIVKMSNTVKTSTGSKNCSLNVSVICNSNGVQVREVLFSLPPTCSNTLILSISGSTLFIP